MVERLAAAVLGRVVPALYDLTAGHLERAGMDERRRALLAAARGRTLELGAGTGMNLRHYPPEVSALVLTEPSAPMAAGLRRRLPSAPVPARVVAAEAEHLPFPDASFDTVACTLVLCSVGDPARAVQEAARVLRPGGALLFIEHVRSEDPRVGRRQDRLRPLWSRIGHGCHPNRRTLSTLEASPLRVERVAGGEMPGAPSFLRPMIAGVARRPATA